MSAATAGGHRTGDPGTRFDQLLEQVWDRGWEPLDLHRLLVRDGDPVATSLLGDLVAANLARYSAVTVEDRWHTQVEEIGASVWWGPADDPVAARADRAKGGWAAVSKAGIRLERTMLLLPQIERLSARPGSARPHSAPGPDVDQRLLTKVRMMLAKAEATTFPAEAETFTAAAQKLMSRHSIDRAMLDQSSGRGDGATAIRLGVDRPYESARFQLISTIARANRCTAVWQKGLGFSTVVGFPTDLRAVELLFTSLMVQATAAMTAQGSREDWSGRSRTRSFRNSFLTAYAVRIGERLDAAAREAQVESESQWGDDPGPSGPGGEGRSDRTALVRVLAQRDQEVEDAVAQRFPRLRHTRSRATFDEEGWSSGTSAADRADLGAPGRLGRTGN
ncbi:DUF2786 domain-containing protein [Ornithinimicrobium cryptoxanthini]|uniref:DUF2786 domain-containing protein n=1 Tax=Ornithinimicrobium cryptoxanthini TaxID=2934161 RepID=A0ABY4YGJ7_9MICO|nr:DUF2786 domain-containing protein [Ornithinimicrobium cryptoxanthini]USQ75468.1 DUF2786 domain-containing protein [Ornithinimicrobium cryptoxanthini]